MRNGLQSDGQDTSLELLGCNGCSLLLQPKSAPVCRFAFSHMCHWNSKDCVENMTAHWACFCAEVTTSTEACLLCCPLTKLVAIFAVDEAAHMHDTRQWHHTILKLKLDRLDLHAVQALAKDAKDLLPAAESNSDAWDTHMTFAHRLIHMVSMLHAMALQHLRGESELTSLTLCPIAHHSQVSCNLLSLRVYIKSTLPGKYQVNFSTFDT